MENNDKYKDGFLSFQGHVHFSYIGINGLVNLYGGKS